MTVIDELVDVLHDAPALSRSNRDRAKECLMNQINPAYQNQVPSVISVVPCGNFVGGVGS